MEAESLRCLSAKYCPLVPSPRSTIAAAFSADGKILASTQYVVSSLCFVLCGISLIICILKSLVLGFTVVIILLKLSIAKLENVKRC